jgi:hypothetical protein
MLHGGAASKADGIVPALYHAAAAICSQRSAAPVLPCAGFVRLPTMRGSRGAVRGTWRLADRHASWHVTHRQACVPARGATHAARPARGARQTNIADMRGIDRSVGVQCTALRLAVLPGATETDVLKIYEVRRAAVAAMRARCGWHACAASTCRARVFMAAGGQVSQGRRCCDRSGRVREPS